MIDQGSIYVSSRNGNLYALDASTGDRIWSAPAGFSRYFRPLVSSDAVCVSAEIREGDSYKYFLRSINRSTGLQTWQQEIPGPPISSSTVADGKLVVAYGMRLSHNLVVVDIYNLAVLDTENGESLWSDSQSKLVGDLAVAGDSVYVVAGNELRALHSETGESAWVYALSSDGGYRFKLVGSILYAWNNDDGGASHLYALPITDGLPPQESANLAVPPEEPDPHAISARVLWNNPLGPGADSDVCVTGGVVYNKIGSSLIALEAATGGLLWRDDMSQRTKLAVADGQAYHPHSSDTGLSVHDGVTGVVLPDLDISSRGNLKLRAFRNGIGAGEGLATVVGRSYTRGPTRDLGIAIHTWDVSTGDLLWSKEWGEDYELEPKVQPVIKDGGVYIITRAHEFHALDAADGKTLWVHPVDSSVYDFTVANGSIYFYDAGAIHSWNAATGDTRWAWDVPGGSAEVRHAPIFADGVVFVSAGRLYALDDSDGSVIWNFWSPHGIHGPVVVDGVVYVSGDGIVAVEAATGEPVWHHLGDEEDASGEFSRVAIANGAIYAAVGGTGTIALIPEINR